MPTDQYQRIQAHNTLLLDNQLDVRKRLADLRQWLIDWLEVDDQLTARIDALDLANPIDIQKGMQIAGLRRKLKMQLVKEPVEIWPPAVANIPYTDLRNHMIRQFLPLKETEKILWLTNLFFILTPDLREINRKIETVRNYRSLGQQRNFLIGGHSGMGKTTYLDWLTSNYLPTVEADQNKVPIIKVDAPVNNGSAKPLFQRMLLECGQVYAKKDTDETLLMKLILVIQKCGVEMIIIDEIEHIERDHLRRRLLEVSNLSRGTPMICASCEPLRWTEGDVEVQGRWNDFFELKQYTGERLQSLLAYLELLLPFPSPSFLGLTEITVGKNKTSPGPARLIQEWTGGILRDIMILIADASQRAIKNGEAHLSVSLLENTWRDIQSCRVTDFLEILKQNEARARRF